MANSLADQLLKAGLVNKKSVHKAKKEKHKNLKQERQGSQGRDTSNEERLAAQKVEQIERDRQLNLERQQEKLQKEYKVQVAQLINQHRITGEKGDIKYNYTDAHSRKVKSIYVTELQQNQLARGIIAICSDEVKTFLIPRIIADKAAQRYEQAILYIADISEQEIDEDDPYKDYQIPDDLMW